MMKSALLASIEGVFFLFAFLLPISSLATPDQDPFYFSKPQPADESGDIINSRRSIFTVDPFFKTPFPGVNAWQVIYKSENATGEDIAVSGTILVPVSSWPEGERPIIGFSVGIRGLGDACAPSYTLAEGYDYESLTITSLLDKGWAVVISDYEGLGTPGDHTFMIGPSQGRVALDMIRAAQRLPESGLSPDAPVVLMGYSQGGATVGWASELAGSYAPELSIVGAVMGGVPVDLEATARHLDGTALTLFALIASVGLNAAYEELDLTGMLNEKGLELLSIKDNVCFVGLDELGPKLSTMFKRIDYYTISNPMDDPLWQFRMAQSKLGSVAPGIPVYLFHGFFDLAIPFKPASALRDDWCRSGVVVDWHPSLDLHVTAMFDGVIFAADWISDRFNGLPVVGNCSNVNRSTFW